VNDSPLILKALSQILSREEGFTVVGAATDGCQALRYASSLAPELVLMGLRLSKLNGAEVTSHIKRSVDPPVVFMVTSDDSPGSRARGEAAGADAFVATTGDLEIGLRAKLQAWFRPNTSPCPRRRHPSPRRRFSPFRLAHAQ